MSDSEGTKQRRRKHFWLGVTGWLIPLVVSAPSLFIWAGLMTMPLIVYLGIMFLSLFNPTIRSNAVDEPYLVTALTVMLLGGPHWPDKLISIAGVALMIYATAYLNVKRGGGLVTGGPYRLVRNPQYFGAMLYIVNLTSRSYREVLGDVGWLGPTATLLVWAVTLLAYIILALIEEAYLTKVFGDVYTAYRRRTGFLVPFVITDRRWVDVAAAVVVPAALLWGLVALNRALFP